MARCNHNFKPCGPQQSMCSKCGELRNTGAPRLIKRIVHTHSWHRDRRSKTFVCRSCGAVK